MKSNTSSHQISMTTCTRMLPMAKPINGPTTSNRFNYFTAVLVVGAKPTSHNSGNKAAHSFGNALEVHCLAP